MLRTIRRLALITSSGLGLMALLAPAALAATATTLPATQVTTTSAVLNGSVATGGQATEWQFQFGTSTHYNKGTPIESIPAGRGTVHVSWKLINLTPNTTYHFRLVAITGIGGKYVEKDYGADRTFTTKPAGKLLLTSKKLKVSGGFVTAPLKCQSTLACNGRFNINTATTKNGTLVHLVCATTFFTIPAGKKRGVKVDVRPGCLELLQQAPHHQITAKLTSRPRTGQQGIIKMITLVLG